MLEPASALLTLQAQLQAQAQALAQAMLACGFMAHRAAAAADDAAQACSLEQKHK